MYQEPLLGLELEPTIAMREGWQLIFQCAQCGLLAVQTNLAHGILGNCPACGHGTWWRQQLPVAGLSNPVHDSAAVGMWITPGDDSPTAVPLPNG